VLGHGEALLAARAEDLQVPAPSVDHSRVKPFRRAKPDRACDEDPLAEFWRAGAVEA
jgi:hypothetical protein